MLGGGMARNPIADRIITKCGGVRKLAGILGLQDDTVRNWLKVGRGLPGNSIHNEILNAARREGSPLRPDDFFDLHNPRKQENGHVEDQSGSKTVSPEG